MPAFCTHHLFLQKLKDEIGKDFEFNIQAAEIGTQGPDIFFFNRIIPLFMPGKSKADIGRRLHRSKAEDLFNAFAEYMKLHPNDIAKSYIYGFIMHYALDRRCHPYVYTMQEKIKEKNHFIHKSSAHNKVEMAMDSFLLNKYCLISNPRSFRADKCLGSDPAVDREIGRVLEFVVPKVTGDRLSAEQAAAAVRDTRKMQKILTDKTGLLNVFCVIFETLLAPFIMFFKFSSMIKPGDLEKAKKYVNIDRQPWQSPFDGSVHNESFEELFTLAAEDARALIKGFNNICNGSETAFDVTQNISFLTGIEVK